MVNVKLEEVTWFEDLDVCGKIFYIRAVRMATGCSLLNAKKFVEDALAGPVYLRRTQRMAINNGIRDLYNKELAVVGMDTPQPSQLIPYKKLWVQDYSDILDS